jgi:hypothetical protein
VIAVANELQTEADAYLFLEGMRWAYRRDSRLGGPSAFSGVEVVRHDGEAESPPNA